MMTSRVVVIVAAVLLVASATGHPSAAPGGQHAYRIKALSDQEIADYLAGRGMGLARAAELNGYPGPAHVLELAKELGLSAEQRDKTEALFKDMQARAVSAGRALLDEEQVLDRLFAARTITASSLDSTLRRIGELQARLRLVHLDAHLLQAALLSPAQHARYAELRGHAGSSDQTRHRHGSH
jgi:Spy/CpxP family protein refolding chaperone